MTNVLIQYTVYCLNSFPTKNWIRNYMIPSDIMKGAPKIILQTPKNPFGIICTGEFRYQKHHTGKNHWCDIATKI